MRPVKKYKQYPGIKELSSRIPSRILKFRRPKWKNVKKSLEISSKNFGLFVNPAITKVSYKYWDKSTDYFKDGIQLKRFLINSFDRSIKVGFLKKEINFNSQNVIKKMLVNCLIRPNYRLDILLSSLNLFSSSYQARQFINDGIVLINSKKAKGNTFIKKGDIISFNSSKIYKHLYLNDILSSFLKNEIIYSFIEIDFYTKTFIVLKDPEDLTSKDLTLLLPNYFDIRKLKTYL